MATVQASADSNADVPPVKKFKQATLPFKKLNNGPPLPTPNSKKRKLSSDGTTPQSQKKTPRRSDEFPSRQQQNEDKENEVTSSSEAEPGLVEKVVSSRSVKKVGLMDKFVRTTQQQEISTSSTEGPTEDVIMIDEDSHQEPVSSALENCDDNTRCGDEAPASKKTKLQDTSNDEFKEEELNNSTEEQKSDTGCQSLAAFGFHPLPKKEAKKENCAEESVSLGEPVACLSNDDNEKEEVTAENHQANEPIVIQDTPSNPVCGTKPDVKQGTPDSASDSKASADHSNQTDACNSVCTSPKNLVNDGSLLKSPEPSQRNSVGGSPGTTPVSKPSGSTPVSSQTPGSTPVSSKTPGSTPGSIRAQQTPSSIKKARLEAERQKKKEERERERLEKQKQREEAKAEKERQRKEEKEKKEREKQEQKEKKEQERKEKMEQKEREKQEKLKAKEEEKKKKQEAMDAKNEEKKKVEEEKKRLEEEKRKLEEEKNKKMQKTKMVFQSFFTKPIASAGEQVSKQAAGTSGHFMPFPLKDNMRMAPAVRIDEEERKAMVHKLDQAFQPEVGNKVETNKLYLTELKSSGSKGRRSGKTWIVDDSTQSDVEIIDEQSKKQGKRMRVKLLQFQENYRPAYYGTWRKNSKRISPRNPLKMDKELLDYEVDSDDEWEEEEPGESLSDSEGEQGEDDGEEEKDEEDDGFFVPHGYLSDDEGAQDEEEEVMTPDRMKAKQLAKAKAWEVELQRKVTQLRAVILGCIWFDGKASLSPEAEELQKFKMCPLVPVDEPIPVSVVVKKAQQLAKPKASGTGQRKPVPEEAMPDLIHLVNGNTCGVQKLMREFRAFWRQKHGSADKAAGDAANKNMEDKGATIQPDSKATEELDKEMHLISKRQLEMKIKDIAVYEKRDQYRRACWYVKQDILEKYQLADLPIPTQWKYITKAVKSGKVNTDDASQTKATNDEKKPVCSKNNPSIAQFTVKKPPGIILAKPQVKQQTKSDRKANETHSHDNKNEGTSREAIPMQVDDAKPGLPGRPAETSICPAGIVTGAVVEVHKEPSGSCEHGEPMEVENGNTGKLQSTNGKSDPADDSCPTEHAPTQASETTPLKPKTNAGLLKWLTPKAQKQEQPAQDADDNQTNASVKQTTHAAGTVNRKEAAKSPQKEGAQPISTALLSLLQNDACTSKKETQPAKASKTSLGSGQENLDSEDVIVLE